MHTKIDSKDSAIKISRYIQKFLKNWIYLQGTEAIKMLLKNRPEEITEFPEIKLYSSNLKPNR